MVIDIYIFNSQGTQSLICLVSLINKPNIYSITWLIEPALFDATGTFGLVCSKVRYWRNNVDFYSQIENKNRVQVSQACFSTEGQVTGEEKEHKESLRWRANTHVTLKEQKKTIREGRVNILHLFTLNKLALWASTVNYAVFKALEVVCLLICLFLRQGFFM